MQFLLGHTDLASRVMLSTDEERERKIKPILVLALIAGVSAIGISIFTNDNLLVIVGGVLFFFYKIIELVVLIQFPPPRNWPDKEDESNSS